MIERGRFAPSPTGEFHLGNLRTALLAWLWSRSVGGGFTLRIEDLDRPRCRPGLAEKQLGELRWLGLDWDEGPGESFARDQIEVGARGPYLQSQRSAIYDAAIDRLRSAGQVYECFCSRAQIRAAQPSEASAPHGPQDDGPRYPGICANLTREQIDERKKTQKPALRLRVPPGPISFQDAIAGAQTFDPATEVGDFVLRRADFVHSYQLAVVVDDAAMGITQVLRGADLLASTARQILLYKMLDLQPPHWAHVPLLFGPPGPDGTPQRLSKRAGEGGLAGLFERKIEPGRVVAALARSSGLVDSSVSSCMPRELLGRFSLEKIGKTSLPISLQ